MMKRHIDRRTLLMAATVAVAAGPGAAQSTYLRGAVTFEGDAVIPKGYIEIYLENLSVPDNVRSRVASMRIKSDGGSRAIKFSLSQTVISNTSPTQQIVARLEREDGWLVARGSTQVDVGSPIHVKLNPVMH